MKKFIMPMYLWLETIEDERLREQAKFNAREFALWFGPEFEVLSLKFAILLSFSWKETPEGHEFWMSYFKSL